MIFKSVLFFIFTAHVRGQDVLTNGQFNGNSDINKAESISVENREHVVSSIGGYNSVYYTIGLPKHFDARKKWPNCPSIGHIYNQGNCRSSYAVSVASAVTDRICIHSNGTKNPIMSSQQIISCCYLCGFKCEWGIPYEAWDFYRRHGFVSGGDYNSSQGCQPYMIKPCKLSNENPSGHLCTLHNREDPLTCETKCYNQHYQTSFRSDIYKGTYYRVNPYMAMKEIYDNGPITTQFYMYKDLIDYKSGVYQYDEDSDAGYFAVQSVKIIGWGEENGLPYWLVANSFGPDWGDHGTFKIARGSDGCFFQENMYAGLPL